MKVNETDIQDISGLLQYECKSRIPDGVECDTAEESSRSVDFHGALGRDFDETVAASGITSNIYVVADDRIIETPLYQEHDPGSGEEAGNGAENDRITYVNRNEFYVNRNSRLTIIQFISSEADRKYGSYIMSTKIHIGPYSTVKLVQIQNLLRGASFYNDCAVECDDSGSFEHVQLVLGGGYTYMGDKVYLKGYKSRYASDIGYNLTGDHRLDMNYIADHTGVGSSSDINVSGVMSDETFKIFRGTIDFHKGCRGAVGKELEDVLLMNEGVTNKTVPLILCDEEDVEGSHGASIGRLDENLMFYLASRGLDEETIYRTMARARIDKVAALIGDEESVRRIEEILEKE